MAYIHFNKRIDQMLSSSGDGADGVGDVTANVAGVAITGATTASPVVCTAAAHGYVDGEWLWIDGATGTTEINGLRKVTNKADNTFELLDGDGNAVNSEGTFGGTVDSQPAMVIEPSGNEVLHLTRMNVWIADASAWTVGGMLGVAALSNGIFVKVWRGDTAVKTLTPQPIKKLADWVFLSGGPDTTVLGDIANNKFEVGVRWTFSRNAEPLHGTDLALRGSLSERLVVYTQDDLDGLSGLQYGVQGWKE
jgi:hypothetical protein